MSWTIALSGPERTREQAEVALEDARIPVLPSDHHAPMGWPQKFPDDPADTAWLTVEHVDVDEAARAVEPAGWRLRVHYETPEAPKLDPVARELADLRREVAELKARVS